MWLEYREQVGGLWGEGQMGKEEPPSMSPLWSKPWIWEQGRSEFPKGNSGLSWWKEEMNAGGQRQKTVTPGFPSFLLATSSQPLYRLCFWPSFEHQLSLDCVQFLSSSHCPHLPWDGSFFSPHSSIAIHLLKNIPNLSWARTFLSSRLTYPTISLIPSVEWTRGT